MVAKILDGKQIAKDYRQGLQDQVEALKEKGFTPKLSVILAVSYTHLTLPTNREV
ncbi:hypothetical protein JMUB7551_23610 [Staphylococcus aureus]